MGRRRGDAGGQAGAVFVRIAEDASARVIARLPLAGGSALEAGVGQIYAWPGSASSVEP